MRRFLSVFLLTFFLVSQYPAIRPSVSAQSDGAYDLIHAVNSLRTDNGLQPYQIDMDLMASAQAHAEYMAETANITHTRADGSTPATLGFTENIAGGYNLTATVAIYSMWTDSAHWNTMVGITYGTVGAGVAIKGGYVYFALQVKRTQTGSSGLPAPNYEATVDPNLVSAVITNTPMVDGAIFHEVLPGQSPWSIATTYGITIEELIAWNNLQPTPVLFAGDRLLVRLAPTVTITPTVTETPVPPTRTVTPTMTPKTPSVTPTITITPTPTRKPLFSIEDMKPANRRWVGISMIAICGIGFMGVVVMGFIKKK